MRRADSRPRRFLVLFAGLAMWLLVAASVSAQDPAADATDSAATDTEAQTLPLLVDVKLRSLAGEGEEEAAGEEGAARDGGALEITVGDRIEAVVTVAWMGREPADDARLPTWQQTWGGAEILEIGEVERYDDASGRRVWRQRLEITAFRPGDVDLPAVTVALPLDEETVEARSEARSFVVRSVLPEAPETPESQAESGAAGPGAAAAAVPEPKGPAEPLPLRSGDRAFAWTAGILLVAALGLLWLVGRAILRQPALEEGAEEPVDPLTLLAPIEELRERLRRIAAGDGAEPAHTALSSALRTYLGRRLRFRAVESTTTEIQRGLRRAAIHPEVAQRVLRLLRQADAVKFARFQADLETTRRRIRDAAELGQEIERQMGPTERLDESEDESDAGDTSQSRRREAA